MSPVPSSEPTKRPRVSHRIFVPFYLTSVLLTLLVAFCQFYDVATIREHFESKSYDMRLWLRNLVHHHQPSPEITIVTVDEKSLAEVGRWPWTRTVMAELVDRIAADHPKVIGIDVLFSEKEGDAVDARLAGSLKKAGNVVLAAAFPLSAQEAAAPLEIPPEYLWDAAFMAVKSIPGIEWKRWSVRAAGIIPPREEFTAVAAIGHVTTCQDLDGVLRWELLAINLGQDLYPAFALQVARLAQGIPPEKMSVQGGSSITLGDRVIATDLAHRVLINYLGKEQRFRYDSATDILHNRLAAGLFTGKIVLIGTSAIATYDQKVTPFSTNYPGVEKNATVVQNIIDNSFIRRSPGIIELVVILVTGMLLVLIIPRLSPGSGVLFGFLLAFAYIGVSSYVLIYHDLWMNLVLPTANMFGIMTTGTITKLFIEERRAREIRAMFSSYVSPKIVEALINNPERAKLGGERRLATILFSDMIGFTTIAERLPPEEVVNMLNEYYLEMATILFRWDGTLDKFVGDEIMALWNAPVDQHNHAELAIRCALHMSDRLDSLREQWNLRGLNIDCGIGINTGEVLIGNIGLQGKKMDYTAIGNHVNIAARVEKMTRSYDTRILITGDTLHSIRSLIDSEVLGHVEIEELDAVKVKGKHEEVRLFAVRSLPSDQMTRIIRKVDTGGAAQDVLQ